MQRPGGYPVYQTASSAVASPYGGGPQYGGGVGSGPIYGGGGGPQYSGGPQYPGGPQYGGGGGQALGAPTQYPLTPKPNIGGPVIGGMQKPESMQQPQGAMGQYGTVGRMGSTSAPGTASGLQTASTAAPAQRPSVTNSVPPYGVQQNSVGGSGYGSAQAPSTGLTGSMPGMPTGPQSAREQVLEKRVRELEMMVNQKDQKIQELTNMLEKQGVRVPKINNSSKKHSPGRSNSGFRKVSDSKPVMTYTATDQDDPIDVRLEEFYNSTGSAIQFRRINRGFYRFGDSIVELNIINHKLMARTEDGWNRGKWGPIEKFLSHYENIEREKAGIMPDNLGD
mmetsp:Transcript_128119/g.226984  ORF Transcript_128119/g.226984 Transcript_128119/m.226984 type:complete len:337 (-) Transcript_128119:95-1105(-)